MYLPGLIMFPAIWVRKNAVSMLLNLFLHGVYLILYRIYPGCPGSRSEDLLSAGRSQETNTDG
jgi:hypothetical protein